MCPKSPYPNGVSHPGRHHARGPTACRIPTVLAALTLAVGLIPAARSAPRLDLLPRVSLADELLFTASTYDFAETPNGAVVLAQGLTGITVLDSAAPWTQRSPARLATLGIPGNARRLAAVGSRVFVAAGTGGLQSVDLTRSSAPALLGSLAFEHEITDVVATTNLIAVADNYGGVSLVDGSDPAAPRRLGGLRLTGANPDTPRLALTGSLLLAATRTRGLITLDVADPSRPRVLGEILTGGGAVAVQVAGRFAYVAGGLRNVLAVDLGDPARPTVRSVVGIPWPAASVAVADGWLYVANSYGGIHTFRLTDPGNPQPAEHGLSGDPMVRTPLDASELRVAGSRLCLALGESPVVGFYSWRLDTPAPLVTECLWGEVGPDGLAASGELACTVFHPGRNLRGAAVPGELTVVDLAAPGGPKVRGRLSGTWGSLAMDGTTVASLTSAAIEFVGVADPARPVRLSRLEPAVSSFRLSFSGGFVHLDHAGGIMVIDARDPAHPAIVGQLDRLGYHYSMRRHGDRLALIWMTPSARVRLELIDVSDPAHPISVGFTDYPSAQPPGSDQPLTLALDDQTACILAATVDDQGLFHPRLDVFSLADPTQPRRVGQLTVADDFWYSGRQVPELDPSRNRYYDDLFGLSLRDGFLYAASEGAGVRIYDVRDLRAPREALRLPWSGGRFFGATRLARLDGRALAVGTIGLAVLRNLPGLPLSFQLRDLVIGRLCTIEASDDPAGARGWTAIRTVTPSAADLTFTEPPSDDPGPGHRFYRASQQP